MLDQKVYSISEWASTVASDPLLRAICGFDSDNAPSVASYYELFYCFGITPIMLLDSNANIEYSGEFPPGFLCLDDKGNPICPGGIPYQNCGYSHPKGIKYRCWFACKSIDKSCKSTDSPLRQDCLS
ncbi:MAG: transposase family protein, partial [Mahella sp.]|nr:transposase family protein [Mahella sp.]